MGRGLNEPSQAGLTSGQTADLNTGSGVAEEILFHIGQAKADQKMQAGQVTGTIQTAAAINIFRNCIEENTRSSLTEAGPNTNNILIQLEQLSAM